MIAVIAWGNGDLFVRNRLSVERKRSVNNESRGSAESVFFVESVVGSRDASQSVQPADVRVSASLSDDACGI